MYHTKNLAISIIPLLLVAILLSEKASAYSFTSDFNNGFYWQRFPIILHKFATDPKDGALLEQLTNEAIEEWESVVGKDIWQTTQLQASTGYSGNYIRWSENFGPETGYDPSKTLAITIRYNRGTFFEQTVIILNGGISYLRQNWGNALKTTIIHEIGHTLGLDHSSAPNAIMAPSLSGNTAFHNDDVSGINAVVDETLKRQSTGFVSPYAISSKEKNGLGGACGSVTVIDRDNDSGSGPLNFVGSLLIGLLVALTIKKRRSSITVRY